jgi:hypothetical protein
MVSIGTLALLVIIGFGATYFPVAANSVVRTGDTVSVAETDMVEGDFYAAGDKVSISGSVTEDVVAAAGQVAFNGSVGVDALLVGGTVDVFGVVGDDLRVIGGEVTIAEPINGDLFVLGGTVDILSTASIAGDVLVFAGDVSIEGSVGGNVLGSVGQLRIDAPVGKGVDVRVGELTLGDRANIAESITYTSEFTVVQSLNATIGGDLIRNTPTLPQHEFDLRAVLIPMLIMLFSVLVWFWASKKTLGMVVERSMTLSVRPLLLGFLTLFLTPIIIGLLVISLLGLPIGMVLFFGYLLLLTLSFVGLPAVLGQLLMRSYNRASRLLSTLAFVVGVVAVAGLMMLPIVGPAIIVGFIIITLGAMVDCLIRPEIKPKEDKNTTV